ncbi:MAG: YbhN family protein [Pseudomonadota bacterium]
MSGSGSVRALIYAFVALIFLYCVYVVVREWDSTAASLARLGLGGLMLVLGLSVFNYLLRAARWHWLLKGLDEKVPWVDGTVCYLAGFALTVTPAKLGEAVKGYYLNKRHRVSYAHTVTAIVVERVADLIAMLLISLAALYVFENFRVFSVLFGVLLLTGIWVLVSGRALPLLQWIREKISRGWFDAAFGFGVNVLDRTRALMSRRVLLNATLLGIVSWSAEAIAFAYIAGVVGIDVNILVLMGVFTLGMLIGAASFIPGGVGSAELALIFMLQLFGASEADAVFVALVSRVTTLWFAVLLGGMAMLMLGLPKGGLTGIAEQASQQENRGGE